MSLALDMGLDPCLDLGGDLNLNLLRTLKVLDSVFNAAIIK